MLEFSFQKKFPHFTLEVEGEAQGGEILALLGASGSGKSLTLRCLAGLEQPDRGFIRLGDRVLFDSAHKICLSPQERRMGFLFQSYALFPHLRVWENIAAGLRPEDQGNRKKWVDEMIERMQLQRVTHARPQQLSGGEQQRVALARMLINRPQALFLDEAFSALDTTLRWNLSWNLWESLQKYTGPIIWVTHDPEEVRRLAAKVCIVERGKAQSIVETQELFRKPCTCAAAQLIGCRVLSTWTCEQNRGLAQDFGLAFDIHDLPDEAQKAQHLTWSPLGLSMERQKEDDFELKLYLKEKLVSPGRAALVLRGTEENCTSCSFTWEVQRKEVENWDPGTYRTVYLRKEALFFLKD